jgi:hypothetical protein
MKKTTFSATNAIDHRNVDWLRKNSTNISGTAENLRQQLKSIEAGVATALVRQQSPTPLNKFMEVQSCARTREGERSTKTS